MNREHNKTLCEIMVDFDEEIDVLDRRVFEAANYAGVGDFDAQRTHAMSPDFQPPIKQIRDRKMAHRNFLAQMLGFKPRTPHDLSPRDYIIVSDGVLVPRGNL